MLGVIIAAGRSIRMGNLMIDKPKCLLEINGKTLIDWQLEAFEKAEIRKVVIIRGYRGEELSPIRHKYLTTKMHIQFCWNTFWMDNNILGSLMAAKEYIKNQDFICCYSDILFKSYILDAMLNSTSSLTLAYDTQWFERYKFRSKHPISEAEFIGTELLPPTSGMEVKIQEKIIIGKGIEPLRAMGEFCGIAMFKKELWPKILINSKIILDENPKAYLTVLLDILAQTFLELRDISIYGKYFEIDTTQDLELARKGWK